MHSMRQKQIITFTFLFVFDQLLKYIFDSSIHYESRLLGFIPINALTIILLVIIYTGIIFYFYRIVGANNYPSLQFTAMIFILAGMSSNLFDVLFFGYVRDFIAVKKVVIFNLADLMIAGGAIGVTFSVIRLPRAIK